MTELESKYVVFKKGEEQPLEEGSFFVVRAQDIFGAATLYDYAARIQTALELDQEVGVNFTPEQREWLKTTADGCVDLATKWQRDGAARKVPDP